MLTFDQYQHALTLIPELQRAAVEGGLEKAGKQLHAWDLDELHRLVNVALLQYSTAYLWLQAFKGVSPSARAKWIEQFSRSARQAPGADGDALALSAWHVLEQAKDRRWKGQAFDEITRLKATRLSLNLERRRIRIGLKQKRRQMASRKMGNPPMEILIHEMALRWMEFFDSFPGIAVARRKLEGKLRQIGGPFLRFVRTLLHAYIDCVPDELHSICPDLRNDLAIASRPRAIAARLRQLRLGVLRRAP